MNSQFYYTANNKYVDLTKMPTKIIPSGHLVIDWRNIKSHKVPFKYNDVEGTFLISFHAKQNKLYKMKLEYNDRVLITTHKQLKGCQLGNLVKDLYSYKYKVDDVVNNSKVVKQIKMGKNNNRGYKMLCLKTNQFFNMREDHIANGVKSPYVTNKKVWEGNSLAVEKPELLNLLNNKDDGYKVTPYSDKEIECKCPNCGFVRKVITKVLTRGDYFCPKCSKKISYPEKFMSSLLELNGLKYEMQKTFDDCKIKRCLPFDFYIKEYNCVIETHGIQHYSKTGKYSYMNIDRSKIYDIYKKNYCKTKGIQYIEIDCRDSNFSYLIEKVKSSPLDDYIKKYDYNKLKDMLNKRERYENVDEIIKDYQDGNTYNYIAEKYNINISTLTLLLKRQGVYKKRTESSKIKVVCLNNRRVFNSITEARDWCNNGSKISQACKNKRKHAGKHPETGEPLKWMYYDDFINQQEML